MRTLIGTLIGITCLYAIFIQLLRIIWLYFPAFIRGTYLYKLREPIKTEMLLYFVLAIVAMSYFIFVTVEKMLQPAEAMAMQ